MPSNFVEKLVGEDLVEFHQSVVLGLRDGDESVSTSVPQDLDFISQDESQLIGKSQDPCVCVCVCVCALIRSLPPSPPPSVRVVHLPQQETSVP